jgi:hypothetical protein
MDPEKDRETAVALAEIEAPDDAPAGPAAPTVREDEPAGLRREWEALQIAFVDEPRPSVEKADALVARAAERLTRRFVEERTRLGQGWSRDERASTEDLRIALREYRSFFERLLAI